MGDKMFRGFRHCGDHIGLHQRAAGGSGRTAPIDNGAHTYPRVDRFFRHDAHIPFCLAAEHSAIDDDHFASNVRGIVRRKKRSHRGDLVW